MIVSIAAFAIALAAPGVSAPASGDGYPALQRRVDGTNVTRVFHTGGGSFENLDNGRWIEFGHDGTLIHTFEEERRTPARVWLIDRQRGGVRVFIDLQSREIWGTPVFGSQRLLYRITDLDADRRGRGWRGRRGGDGGGMGRDDDRGGWDRGGAREIEVGPIWNQRDAETKCANKARELRGTWNGQWRTTVQGRMSVCSIDTGRGGPGGGWDRGSTRNVEVGPIWNQADAENKCRNKARELRGEWTGQWSTTQPGRMSVCEIRFR
ncbi:mannan-binding lectin [Sphingomonas soli]|uniref:mannan-binding lectin n=1 Tax=Sphingomonas soli TaxID=266127 RepID=UPI00082AEF2D|nr:mannan-binding lectin [Sphingomonas soli]